MYRNIPAEKNIPVTKAPNAVRIVFSYGSSGFKLIET